MAPHFNLAWSLLPEWRLMVRTPAGHHECRLRDGVGGVRCFSLGRFFYLRGWPLRIQSSFCWALCEEKQLCSLRDLSCFNSTGCWFLSWCSARCPPGKTSTRTETLFELQLMLFFSPFRFFFYFIFKGLFVNKGGEAKCSSGSSKKADSFSHIYKFWTGCRHFLSFQPVEEVTRHLSL